MFAGYEKYSVDDIENKLRNKFPEAVRKSIFPSLGKFAGKIPGTVGKKAKSLLTSLSHDPAMGFYITNSMMTDDMWQSLVKKVGINESYWIKEWRLICNTKQYQRRQSKKRLVLIGPGEICAEIS